MIIYVQINIQSEAKTIIETMINDTTNKQVVI